jgi:hypothetical protein
MTDTMTAPTGKMLAVFLGTLLFGNLLLAAIGYFFPDFEIPGSIGIVFQVVAAMAAGGAFATAMKRKMTAGEKFRFAILATLLGLLLAAAVFWAILAYVGLPFTLQNAVAAMTGEIVSNEEIMSFLPIFLGVAVGVAFLINFFGVGFGAGSQLKQAAKLAAKGR